MRVLKEHRVLVCGSRDWRNRESIRAELQKLPSHTVIIHGGCRGADRLAGEIADELGLKVLPFPADWDQYGLAAGPIRNQQMLDDGKPHRVLAFHPDIQRSRGTKDLAKRARRVGVPVQIVTQ